MELGRVETEGGGQSDGISQGHQNKNMAPQRKGRWEGNQATVLMCFETACTEACIWHSLLGLIYVIYLSEFM